MTPREGGEASDGIQAKNHLLVDNRCILILDKGGFVAYTQAAR
jgi:hypothetical protein